MKYKTQDPKFWIGVDDNSTPVLVGQSGPVPADEPLFILRGRDVIARELLKHYRHCAENAGADTNHLEAIERRIKEFSSFAWNHPERMKVPDTDLSQLHDGKPS